jgi:GT2 family glycosyltransferase/SAM-dependent methyltransferase
VKKVGILYDNISGNTGDQAIGISVRNILTDIGIEFEELVPGRFNPRDYPKIVVGGGHLLRPSPDFFYDKFKVTGSHILNTCGIVSTPSDLNYLNGYSYVSVRSNGDKQAISYLKKDVKVVPCTTMLLPDLLKLDQRINKHSIGIQLLEGAVDEEQLVAYLSTLPFQIYFLPINHHLYDFNFLARLSRKIKKSILLSVLTPQEISTIIGKFEYFVSCSYHGALFAYAHNVPFMLFNGLDKQRFFMRDRNLESYLFKDLAELKKIFQLFQKSRPDYSALIEKDLKKLKSHINTIKDILPAQKHVISARLKSTKSDVEPVSTPIKQDQAKNIQIHYLQKQIEGAYAQDKLLHTELGQKKTQITSLKNTLQTKETRIAALSASLGDKNSQIHKLKAEMHTGDFVISEFDAALKTEDSQKANLEKTLQAKDSQIAGLNFTLQNKEYQINRLEMQIQQVQRGVAMQLWKRYHNIVKKLLPNGTGRWYYYETLMKGVRIILNEGWPVFRFKFRRWFRRRLGKQDNISTDEEIRFYQQSVLKNEPKPAELKKQKRDSWSFLYRPKISIITPVWNTELGWLKSAIESVINQTYDNWEICIADGNSDKPGLKQTLQEYARKEPRIKIKFLRKNKGTAGNSNEALSLATGEFVGFLDHDDELKSNALFEVVKLLNDEPKADFIYSDEVLVDELGRPSYYYYRPDFSLDYLLSHPYIVHLAVIRKKLVDEVDGFREEFPVSQDYDLFLRIIEKTRAIFHIPKALYSWRTDKSSSGYKYQDKVMEFSKKALTDFIKKMGIKGDVYNSNYFNFFRVQRKIIGNPKVSIIIPTKDKLDILQKCVESIESKTTYKNYEVIIVDNLSQDAETVAYLNDLQKNHANYKVLKFEENFNFSRLNNFAARHAQGEHLLFLNNDVEVISPEWLAAMVEHSQRKEVGCVGAKLLYPNDNIQHVGVVIGLNGCCEHVYKFTSSKNDIGYMGHFISVRNWSAVTAACLMIKKKTFNELHGFDEILKVGFGDVDLCLRAREKGYLNVFTPYAELYHYESATRGTLLSKPFGFDPHPEDSRQFNKRWWKLIKYGDPYYNKNLPLNTLDITSYVKMKEHLQNTPVAETSLTPAFGKNGQLVLPPELAVLVGGKDAQKVGLEFFKYLKDFCNLNPKSRVLDVGSGVGRMAIPITQYLERLGLYEGFDTLNQGIDWCKANITPRYPNFHFQYVDIYNKTYNPKGKIIAKEFQFPYEDETFDVVFLASVFTHMLSGDVAHYFNEIRRVLRNSGRCLITFFLLNGESSSLIVQGKSTIDFKYGEGLYKWKDIDTPENAIAYQEEHIRTLCNENSLKIVELIHYGSWSGRENYLSYQDIIIVEKS